MERLLNQNDKYCKAMTKTSNLQIDVIRQVTGCDREDAECVRKYMEEHSIVTLGKLKLSQFIETALRSHLIVMLKYHQN